VEANVPDRNSHFRRVLASGAVALSAIVASSHLAPAYAQEAPEPGTSLTILEVSSYAEARIVVFQSIIGNTILQHDSQIGVSIANSGNNTHGIFQYNANAGMASNQANIHAIAVVGGRDSTAHLSSVYVVRETGGNSLTVSNSVRSTSIVDSFNNSSGLFAINVNAGNLNNQVNAFALAFGNTAHEKKSIVRVSDHALGTVLGEATEVEISGDNTRTDTIQDSFRNFSGLLQMNVASGDGNAMAITSTVNVTVRTLR
jgi:hypothetical protein